MKALFYKDLCTLKKQIMFYFLFYIVYTFIMIQTQQIEFLAGVLIMIGSTMPVSAIAYDEQSKWQLFGQVLPIAKKDFVVEKYLLGICGMIFSAGMVLVTGIVGSLFGLLEGNQETMLTQVGMTVTVLGVGLMMLSISLPIIFKMGVEKARFLLLGGNLLLFLAVVKVASASQFHGIIEWMAANPMIMLVSAVVVVMGMLVISAIISNGIYKKKEFC